MVPAFFVPLERLPLNRLGKVDRRALPAPRGSAGEPSGESRVAPATPTAIEIARIWTAVLGFDALSIHDNFFALGGHSLMATRVAARIAEDLGVDLPLAILFEKPTISELTDAVDARRADAARSLEDILAEVEGLSDDQARAHLRT
jgi:acyl carrier protein